MSIRNAKERANAGKLMQNDCEEITKNGKKKMSEKSEKGDAKILKNGTSFFMAKTLFSQ